MRGNRRSDNIPEGEGSAAEDAKVRIAPAEPQTSSQGLQFAGFTPIQPLPSIKEVTAQTLTVTQQVLNPQTTVETQNTVSPQPKPAETETQNAEEATQNAPSQQPVPDEVETQNFASLQPEANETGTQDAATETFEECWNGMVDVIFQKKPAFYHQLRDYLPRYENEIIYVEVENDFQKNQLEMSKRAMLEYWRAHYTLNVNEMEFVIHEHERKKVIYTSEDKVNNMLEQNTELKDFLQVLNFRIKD